jgi:hypothetical protein
VRLGAHAGGVALALNAYFIQVNYALAIVALTIVVSQLYVQLGEYSNDLLLMRLEITAVGAVIGGAVAVLVFPVATRSALSQVGAAYLAAQKSLLERVRDTVAGRAPVQTLTMESRRLDDTLAQMLATARPLTRGPFRRDQVEYNMALWKRGPTTPAISWPRPAMCPLLSRLPGSSSQPRSTGSFRRSARLLPPSAVKAGTAACVNLSSVRSTYSVAPTTAATAAMTHAPSSGVRSPGLTEH